MNYVVQTININFMSWAFGIANEIFYFFYPNDRQRVEQGEVWFEAKTFLYSIVDCKEFFFFFILRSSQGIVGPKATTLTGVYYFILNIKKIFI